MFDGLSSKYLVRPLFARRDISTIVFSFVIGTRPHFGTFLRIVKAKIKVSRKEINKEKMGIC